MRDLSALRRGAYALACAAGLFLASPASAFDELDFRTGSAGDDLRSSLRAASLIVAAQNDGTTDPQELLAAARADYSRFIGALYAAARYAPAVSIRIDGREAASIPPLAQLGDVGTITVEIEPGPVYEFSTARAAPLAPGTELPDTFAVGEPARTGAIRAAAEAAVTGWRAEGYAKAEVGNQRIVARHPATAVDVDLGLAPGRQLRFGGLDIRGADRVREERIRHLFDLPRGRTFDPEAVQQGVDRLRRTGAFRSVSATEADTAGPNDTLDIILRLQEEQPRRYGIGLEYATTDGLAVSAFWLHRNLLGGAERFRIEGEWAGIDGATGGMDYRIGAEFKKPGARGPDTDLYIVGEVEQLNEPDFNSSSVSAAIGYTRIASEELSVGAGIGFRFSSINDDDGNTEYKFLTLPLTATWDSRDDTLNPTRGIFATGDLTAFAGIDGSPDGARFLGDARTYYALGSEDRPTVIAGRLQFGSILGASLASVPNDYRFYSGGGGTVRGQEYQSLDIDLNGSPSGGASFLGLSAEARVPVSDSFALVGFADWGYVGRNSLPDDTGGSHAGAGLGIRYITPIGPIRLDLATPISDGDFGDELHVYIGIGQAF